MGSLVKINQKVKDIRTRKVSFGGEEEAPFRNVKRLRLKHEVMWTEYI